MQAFWRAGKKWKWVEGGGKIFAREPSAKPRHPRVARNRAEISLSFFEFFSGGARKRKIVRENFCEVAAGAIAEAGGGAFVERTI
jgi:DnaJ-class molecular chaperone